MGWSIKHPLGNSKTVATVSKAYKKVAQTTAAAVVGTVVSGNPLGGVVAAADTGVRLSKSGKNNDRVLTSLGRGAVAGVATYAVGGLAKATPQILAKGVQLAKSGGLAKATLGGLGKLATSAGSLAGGLFSRYKNGVPVSDIASAGNAIETAGNLYEGSRNAWDQFNAKNPFKDRAANNREGVLDAADFPRNPDAAPTENAIKADIGVGGNYTPLLIFGAVAIGLLVFLRKGK